MEQIDVACSVKEEVAAWSNSKQLQVIGTSSGK